MSLINDALKRAAEAEKRQTGTRPRRRAPKGAESLGPMIHTKPVKTGRDMLSISPAFGLIMLIILMCGLSSFLLHGWWTKRRPFKPNIPEGMDPLEAMILTDSRLTANRPEGPIVVTEKGVKGTEGPATNQVDGATNTVSSPPDAPVPENTDTNSPTIPPPTSPSPPGTNALSAGPLLATADPGARPNLPAAPKPAPVKNTNLVSGPVKLPDTRPSGPVIVRPRAPEGTKTRAQIDAERKAREGERAMMATNRPVVIGPARSEEREIEFPEINVGAIIIKQDSGSAYVNGKIITLGDLVSGAELVEIRREYLTFATNGARKNFYLAQ